MNNCLNQVNSIGGSMWESNPPMTVLAPQHSFEDWQAHQHLSTPIYLINLHRYFNKNLPVCQHKIWAAI